MLVATEPWTTGLKLTHNERNYMNRTSKIATLLVMGVLIATLAFSFLSRNNNPSKPITAKPEISATIFPLYDITQNIAGDVLEVNLILPPGASPHTFEPRPSDMRDVDESAVVYAIGHGLDQWASTITESTETPLVVVDAKIALKTMEEDAEIIIDPHYWLSVSNAKIITTTITEDLSQRFPESATIFAANAAAYQLKLDSLDAEIKSMLETVTNRNLVTMHDAWGYFSDAYGLKIAGSFEPAPGKEPTPAWIGELASVVKKAKVKAIYAEPQLSSEGIEAFAADHNLKIVTIDPEGSDLADSYIDMMRQNAQAIRDNQ